MLIMFRKFAKNYPVNSGIHLSNNRLQDIITTLNIGRKQVLRDFNVLTLFYERSAGLTLAYRHWHL